MVVIHVKYFVAARRRHRLYALLQYARRVPYLPYTSIRRTVGPNTLVCLLTPQSTPQFSLHTYTYVSLSSSFIRACYTYTYYVQYVCVHANEIPIQIFYLRKGMYVLQRTHSYNHKYQTLDFSVIASRRVIVSYANKRK